MEEAQLPRLGHMTSSAPHERNPYGGVTRRTKEPLPLTKAIMAGSVTVCEPPTISVTQLSAKGGVRRASRLVL